MLYAIGEIILIVIGIMIALQLDNSNEERKEKAEIVKNLIELRTELESNISKVHGILRFYNNRDSLIRQHLCKTIAREDIKSTNDLQQQWVLITSNLVAPLDRVALDKVLSDLENLPKELENLKYGLRYFDAKYEEIDLDHKEYYEIAKGEDEYRAKNLNWYRETWRWDKPLEQEVYTKAIDYLFDDPHYQNQLYTYWKHVNFAIVQDILECRQVSIFWIEFITNYLDKTEQSSYQLPEELRTDLSGLVGTYRVFEKATGGGTQIREMGEYILFEEDSRLVSFTRFDPELQKNVQSDRKVEWVVLDSKTVISPSGWFMHLVQRDSSIAALEYAGCNNRNLYFHKIRE
jgi:hypothetical protein